MFRQYMNRQWIRVFTTAFLCIVVLASAVASAILYNASSQLREGYLAQIESDADRIAGYYGQTLLSAFNAANAIYSTRWYKHYRNISGYYLDEFDTLKRNEIANELQNSVSTLQFVEDILIITPSMDSVICRRGWFTQEFYASTFGMVETKVEVGQRPQISSALPQYSLIVLQDTNMRHDYSVIAVLLKRDELNASLRGMMSPDARHYRMTLDGGVLAEWGEETQTLHSIDRAVNLPRLEITIGYRPVNAFLASRIGPVVALVFLAVVLGSCILAFVLATAATKPVTDIVISIGGDEKDQDDPFRFLLACLQAFSHESSRLREEKDGLLQSHTRFLRLLENEVLFGMLTNGDFDYENPGIHTAFPWFRDGLPLFLAVAIPKYGRARMSDDPRYDKLKTMPAHLRHATINEEDILFFWLDEDGAEDSMAAIRVLLESWNAFHIVASPLLTNPREISRAYQDCKRSLSYVQSNWLELPVSIELRVHNTLQTAKMDECMEILAGARDQFNPDVFLQLFVRVAMEYEMPLDGLMARYRLAAERGEVNQQWAILNECIAGLCKTIALERQSGGRKQIAAICSYVDKAYADPDLCIDQIAAQFSLHPTLVSKRFKAYTGKTFSDYLQDLRLSSAQRLLRDSTSSIGSISESVGYGNYQTFMRAFNRHFGLSPREYRLGAHETNRREHL